MIYVILAVVLIIIFLIIRKFNRIKGLPVLQARINTNDGVTYNVEFEKLNSETTSIEYLRLLLSFISKIYYITDESKEMNRINIKYFLDKIADSNNFISTLEGFSKQIIYSEENIKEIESKTVIATAIFKDVSTRYVSAKLPTTWYSNQLYHSILALSLATVKYLNEYQKEILFKSLKNLDKYYKNLNNPDSLKSSYIFPNQAFIEATIQ